MAAVAAATEARIRVLHDLLLLSMLLFLLLFSFLTLLVFVAGACVDGVDVFWS